MDLLLGDEATIASTTMSPTSTCDTASYIDMVGAGGADLDLDSFLLNECWTDTAQQNQMTPGVMTSGMALSPDANTLFTDSGITSPNSELDSLPITHSPLSSTSSSSMSVGSFGNNIENFNNQQTAVYSTMPYMPDDPASHMMIMHQDGASPSLSNSSLSDSPSSSDDASYYDSSHVINFNDLNENQDTEELLNNIEHMLKSLQDNDSSAATAQTIQQQPAGPKSIAINSGGNKIIIINNNNNGLSARNLIKQEPVDVVNRKVNSRSIKKPTTTTSIQMRPILPKDPNIQVTSATHQPVHQVLTVPSPESIKASMPQQSRNKVIKPIEPSSVKPQQQVGPVTVLATIPASALSTLPIIIGTNSVSTTNNPVIETTSSKDYSCPKRLKSDQTESKSEGNESPVIALTTPKPNVDIEVMKKQSRMIKNRESACLSRKRKKEYMTTLEDTVKSLTDKNETLTKENQTLRERVASLEAENKMLRQQPMTLNKIPATTSNIQIIKPKIAIAPSSSSTTLKTQPVTLGSNLITIKPNQTVQNGSTQSLKRPFIMLAVFLVFGLNIFQFVNVNSPNSAELNSRLLAARLASSGDASIGLEAALEAANARDNALVDTALLARTNVKARHLLSASDEKESISSNRSNRSRNDTMELVMINGTWHLLNLSMCYNMMSSKRGEREEPYYNQTDMVRMNSELNGWLARHRSSRFSASPAPSGKRTQNGPSSSSTLLRNLNRNRIDADENKVRTPSTVTSNNDDVYPISVYDNAQHSKRYESFVRSIRQRNDTFYFISFRRDYAILAPTLAQNKTQRPRISLLMPALLSSTPSQPINNNDSTHQSAGLAFMRIDCEVTDTSLFHLKLNDIPLDYMKIIHQDFIMYGGAAGSGPQ